MSENGKSAPLVDEIARALGNKADRAKIEHDMQDCIRRFKLSPEDAKRIVLKQHGGKAADIVSGGAKRLADLLPNEMSVDVLGRVLSIQDKEIEVESGRKSIKYGLLADSTKVVPYTAWEKLDFELRKGDCIRAKNAYTKEWMGQPQLNFGTRTTIVKESADAIPTSSLPARPAQKLSVAELREGTSGVEVTVRILEIEKREVNVEGAPAKKTVHSGVAGDATGLVQFSAWHDFKLKQGGVFRIAGAYVKTWRGIPQLCFDERSTVEKADDRNFPAADAIRKSNVRTIEDLTSQGGAVDVTVNGIVIDIKPGSGLVFRCPQCKRVVQKGACKVHGPVEGKPDLRIKAVLDDGTGSMTVVIGRELTEKLIAKKLKDCIEKVQSVMNADVIRDMISQALVARPVGLTGRVTQDDYGLMMIAQDALVLRPNLAEEARAMLAELEGS